jgi:hypothetical protein
MAGVASLATDGLAWGPPRRKRNGTTAWLSLPLRDGTLNAPHSLPGPLGSNKSVNHSRISAKKRSGSAATGLKDCLRYPSSFELQHLTGHPLPRPQGMPAGGFDTVSKLLGQGGVEGVHTGL